jgi:group II intron reverse transcriptase/maturase
MRTADTILGLIRERGKKRLPLERVYKLLFNQDLYLKAYGKIYQNKGAMTHGVTEETPDGMSLEKIDAIIEAIRYERYQWLPARRTYIPKKNGKKRPLGMPVWSDKLVQEVLRSLLEAYFEPQFSDHSHGFRPERGCHTALREIYRTWHGTTWFLEGDISQCFDKLSHELLLDILKKHIHDERFIRFIRELFDAGYVEDWTYNETLSGVPQGGIVSPILSNILLNELDTFVETVLLPKYNKGAKRKPNSEYHKLMKQAWDLRKQGKVEKAEELRKQAQMLPSMETNDPKYRRLKYIRYADDFLLGFAGPKTEAEEIKRQLKEFLQEELKLDLSEEKTLITHARSEAAKFLGYEITMLQNDTKRTKRRTNGTSPETMCRSINSAIGLQVPKDVIEEKCHRYMSKGKVMHRKELQQVSDYEIIMTYQLEYRGIVEYYRLAHNMIQLRKLKGVMQTSLTKTLAAKHKLPVSKVYEKYGAKLVVEGKEYQVLQAKILRQDKKPLIASWGGVPLKWNIKATLQEQPQKFFGSKRTELEQRLLAGFCELCGRDKDVEMHHVQAMRKLHEYPGRPKPEWVKRMIALKRKTIPLCRRCHEATEHGLPITWPLISLEEIKERRKQSRSRC